MESLCAKAFRRGQEINRFRKGQTIKPKVGLLSAMFDDSEPDELNHLGCGEDSQSKRRHIGK